MVVPASPVPECWSGFVRRAAVGDDARYRRRIICHAGDNRRGGRCGVNRQHKSAGHRAAITRRIGGAKGERVATVCKRRLRRETPRAVAIHRRGTDGRGITVKIDINRRACLSAPVQGGRRIVR